MREIDLGEEVKIKVKIGSESYVLREPTQEDIELLSNEDNNQAFFDFIVKLGLPKHVTESLGVIRLKKLADSLTEELSAKK